jgi:hypothetical protein
MFYSRPNIEPLGWDLVALPTPNGSRNFDAVTADGRAVDFRFSSGWLTVSRAAAGVIDPDAEMEEVVSRQIGYFGITEILPEQICDILGLTVQDKTVPVPTISQMASVMDWSGRTTYWQSVHRMMMYGDAEALTKKIHLALPGSVLLQPLWEGTALKLRCRQIKFLIRTDEVVTIAVRFDNSRLAEMLAAEEISTTDYLDIVPNRIDIDRTDWGEDLTGKSFIDPRGADKLELDYHVIRHRRYRIHTEYATDDAEAQSMMKELLGIIDNHFCRGFQVVNLRTAKVIEEDLFDEEDTRSYSRMFRDWCLQEPRRHLFVHARRDPQNMPSGNFVFVGYRPIL